jgi:hypothetical protein
MSEEEGGRVVHRVTDLVVIQVQHNNLTKEKWSKNNIIIQWGSNTLQEHDQHISFLNHFEVGIAAETSCKLHSIVKTVKGMDTVEYHFPSNRRPRWFAPLTRKLSSSTSSLKASSDLFCLQQGMISIRSNLIRMDSIAVHASLLMIDFKG